MRRANIWLMIGGGLSAAAALAHVVIVIGGPAWYRFFGAGEQLARLAERGSPVPALVTLAIATVLAGWAGYAFAGAGLIRRLPFTRAALVLITGIYLARGLVVFSPDVLMRSDLSSSFLLYSSLIVLAYGVIHAVGTWQVWTELSSRNASA